MKTASTRHLILLIIYLLSVHFVKTYCHPRRATIQRYLANWFGRHVSLSDIDYHLGILKEAGLIKSFPNYGRRDDGTVYGKASNRQLTGECLYYLKATGVKIAKYLWVWLSGKKHTKDSHYKNNDLPQQDLDKRSDSGFEKISLLEILEPP